MKNINQREVKEIGDRKTRIKIYDTTLRDGSQFEGISFSLEDKIKIARKLDNIGINYIEGGWPGSNPKDIEFFKKIKSEELRNSVITAFGSTRKPGLTVREDSNLQALLEAETETATLVGKSWDFHVEKALNTTAQENLNMIYDSISYLKDRGMEVFFDAEHFFDGYKNNPDYALEVLQAAYRGGADCVVLCDTNGGTLPWELERAVSEVRKFTTASLGIHTHNDCNCAVSNAILAARLGCGQIQGTINGYGERCGNADLCSVIPILELKLGWQVLPAGHLRYLTETSHYISELANLPHHNHQPFVGYGAFAHKGGIHVSALLKDSSTYEHTSPELVGNKRRVLVSELAGLSNIEFKAKEFNIDLDLDAGKKQKAINEIKILENQGFQFEGADASLELYLRKALGEYEDFFSLDNF
ncbi:MAG: citramalate synthase, partial [Syntrophomonadaceae bacterium]|nr:citramalate synthase [Syntrophomonadaceae bacterium]